MLKIVSNIIYVRLLKNLYIYLNQIIFNSFKKKNKNVPNLIWNALEKLSKKLYDGRYCFDTAYQLMFGLFVPIG